MRSVEVLAVSQAVLLLHYAVYVPVMMRDPECTTSNIWGGVGQAGRAVSLLSASLAYALHLISLWTARDRTLPRGMWLGSLAYYVLQTAFLPALRQANCRDDAAFAVITRLVLGACAAAMLWYAISAWRSGQSPFVRWSSVFVAFHVAVVDFLYFGFVGVP